MKGFTDARAGGQREAARDDPPLRRPSHAGICAAVCGVYLLGGSAEMITVFVWRVHDVPTTSTTPFWAALLTLGFIVIFAAFMCWVYWRKGGRE